MSAIIKALEALLLPRWVERCTAMQTIPNLDVVALARFVVDRAEVTGDKDLAHDALAWAAIIYAARPIVEYTVSEELILAMQKTPLPSDMTLEDLPMPFDTFAITTGRYSVVLSRRAGWFAVGTPDNKVLRWKTTEKLTESVPDPAMLGILLYITHHPDDAPTTTIPARTGKKYRNRPQVEVIKGIVGGKFTAAVKGWNTAQASNPHRGSDERGPMRPHIRAGHWHRYHVGKGRTETKFVFLHPCLVNAEGIAPGTTIERKVQ